MNIIGKIFPLIIGRNFHFFLLDSLLSYRNTSCNTFFFFQKGFMSDTFSQLCLETFLFQPRSWRKCLPDLFFRLTVFWPLWLLRKSAVSLCLCCCWWWWWGWGWRWRWRWCMCGFVFLFGCFQDVLSVQSILPFPICLYIDFFLITLFGICYDSSIWKLEFFL